MGAFELIVVAGLLFGATFLAVRAWSGRTRRHEFPPGLPDNPASRAALADYSRQTAIIRWRGVIAALLVHVGVTVAGPAPRPFDGTLVPLVLGYLLGVLVGEMSVRRRPLSEVREASLTPRQLPDYISPFRLWGLRTVAAGSVVAAWLLVVLPAKQPPLEGWARDADLATSAVAALIVVVLVEVGGRRVARRPPSVDSDAEMVEEALRARAVHRMVAAGTAIALFLLGGALWTVGDASSVHLLRWTFTVLGGLCAFVGFSNLWLLLEAPGAPARTARSAVTQR